MKKQLKDVLHYYLGTGLRINTIENELASIINNRGSKVVETIFRGHLINVYEWDEIRPHLRPLSSLTKEITVEGYNNGEPFVPFDDILGNSDLYRSEWILEEVTKGRQLDRITELPFFVIELLLKWQFNVFNIDESQYIEIRD